MSRNHARLDWRRWKATRLLVLHADHYRCRSCGWPGWLEVDHIVPLADDPTQDAYDPAGCQSLCACCHKTKTADENRARRPLSAAALKWRDFAAELR